MKNRLGVLALTALIAACSGQNNKNVAEGSKAQEAQSAESGGMSSGSLLALSRDAHRTIANAPDRGALLTYSKQAAIKKQGAYTLLPVQLSEEHAIRGVVTGLMTIPAPDGSEIKVRYDRTEEGIDGNWSWIGSVVGGDAGQKAIITFGEHAVSGTIPQAIGLALSLKSENGQAYMVQADASRLKKVYRAGGDVKIRALNGAQGDSSEALVAAAKTKAAALASTDVSTKAFSAANTIDLVVGYSNGFVSANSGASGAATRLSQLVAISNQALLDSKVNARIRVVSAIQVNYADNTDNGLALDQLTGSDGKVPVTVPAALAPLRAARDEKGADLVTLIRDFQPENNGCGIAWLLGANGTPITAAGDAPFGYSVVSDGTYKQGNDNNYYCENISLIHELAHNMGSAHDIANAGADSGRYPYSYGYKTTVAAGNFFTVMAYGDDNQTIYRVFSNPNITTCGGLACGVANQADNARSLGQTIPVVSTFRNTVVPLVAGARNDVNGDLKSDLLWRSAQGRLSYWLMSGAVVSYSSPSVAQGTNYALVATGDFNGDGRSDLVWRSTANVVLWSSTGTGTSAGFTAATISTTPAGWSIVGAADLDGDGISDLLWRNASTGSFAYWLMSGSAVKFKSASIAIAPSYKLVAIGDFNGDGIGDLVWDNNVSVWLWRSVGNGSFDQLRVANHPAGWAIIGAGDIDGDSKSDLLWRNTSTGRFSYWLMNSATISTRSASVAIAPSYKLVAVGDLNGDSKADLVWDNNVSVWAWLTPSTGLVFSQKRIANHPGGWTSQNPLGQ